MEPFAHINVWRALAIVGVGHAILALLIAGMPGAWESVTLVAGGAVAIHLSGTTTVGTFIAWQQSYETQFRIWVTCTGLMALFLLYRSGPRVDIALLQATSSAFFFLAFISVGNRIKR